MINSDDDIARLIAGGECPAWLVFFVAKARVMLAQRIKGEREYPLRTKLRARLKRLDAALEIIRREMRDFDVAMLLRAGDNFFLNESETCAGLGDIAERVKRTLGDVPKGPGPHKYFGQPTTMTPHQICALMVCTLWAMIHRKAPPNANQDAQEACRNLWIAAAGGPVVKQVKRQIGKRIRLPGDDASTEVWRDHFKAAKLFAQSPESERVRRGLDWDERAKRDAAWWWVTQPKSVGGRMRRTTVKMTDGRAVLFWIKNRGRVGEEPNCYYETVFRFEGREITSSCPRALAEGKDGADARLEYDAKLLLAYGVILKTIDLDNLI